MRIKYLSDKLDKGNCGAKAFYLSDMIRKGYNVPQGFVIVKSVHQDYLENESTFNKDFITELKEALATIGSKKYMVRSSAIGEDSADSSFAGQLESYQSSNGFETILENIKSCWKSYGKSNVAAYEQSSGKVLNGMAVVVQELISPDIAGVIFTRNPMAENELLIEYVDGHGENLVSGNVHPTTLNYVRVMGAVVAKKEDRFGEAIEISQKLESDYGMALDIEWAIKDHVFYLLQCRPVTTIAKGELIHWSNTNVNENYPTAISPLLYSIARESYYHYFKNLSKLFLIPERSIQELESSYANVIGVFACKMYYNMSSIYRIFSSSPFSSILLKSFNDFVGHNDESIERKQGSIFGKIKFSISVIKQNLALKKAVLQFENTVDEFKDKSSSAVSFDELKSSFHSFVEIRMHSWYKASLADFFAMVHHGILGVICEKHYSDDATKVHNKLIQAIPDLVSTEPILLIHDILVAMRSDKNLYHKFLSLSSNEFWEEIKLNTGGVLPIELISKYISEWGFRCSGELMLTTKNYTDDPEKFISLLQQYDKFPDKDPRVLLQNKAEEREQVMSDFKRHIWKKYWFFPPIAILHVFFLKLIVKLATNGIKSRERVRLKQALLYYELKKLIKKCGKEFKRRDWLLEQEDILFMRYQEIIELLNSSSMIPNANKTNVSNLKKAHAVQKEMKFPDEFSCVNGGDYQPVETKKGNAKDDNEKVMKGMSACGGKVTARARVLDSIMEAGKIEQGDILITRQTDPGWIVVFPLISGLAVERGGMLSHGAIVSREFGIPAVVGVKDVTSKIKDGQMICLNADTGEITLIDE
ncbi:MAG: phosphoenolpyruvate synthase/pyruvate phosphate dikinase [Glaciecola sp.]|jgi:phosphoenolpyruvate synthase/pyruvate phosphate dikinase